jgi:putative ABC transport system permease protein
MQPVVNADMKYVAADQDFVSTYGISMAAGRNFSRDFPTDTSGFLINESALPLLGCTSASEAIGKDLKYGDQEGKVIGVMKDINFESLHQKITPLILVYPTSHGGGFGRMTVRLSGSDTRAALVHVEATWKKFMPEKPFDYTFLDDNFDRLYKSETRQEQIFSLFAGIAIFIACMGLLGLSAFTISQRIREIGIRKVLGAGTGSIVQLISGDFLKLVVIAALIAFPIAWYAMHQWLGGFAYRAPMGWGVFVLAAGIALIVAFVTIGIQTLKAASANPIKHLRSE